MTKQLRVCLALSGLLPVLAMGHRADAISAPSLAWDESSSGVNGYALTVDGVRKDYGLSPVSSTGACGCSLPLPFSGGRHTLVVSAYNATGETASSPMIVAPIAKPGGPYTSQVGASLTVDGSGSSHPAGTIVGYAWNWGDGTKSSTLTSPTTSHTYQAAGTVQITLTVTDNAGATASASTTATISTVQGTPAGTVVLWAANTPLANIHGAWSRLSDSTAAGKIALWNPNAGAQKIAPALANPANDFEQTFQASAGTAYHLWVRLKAQNNSFGNDSIHVQFNDSTDDTGRASLRIGSTDSAEVVLQNGPNGSALHGWGWSDNGWGALGDDIYFASSGAHTVRVQSREDGASVDQIVLSPDTYATTPPGPRKDDTTILQNTDGAPPTVNTILVRAVDVAATRIHGAWQRLTDATAAGGTALWNPNKGAAKIDPASASPANYFEATFTANAGTTYHVWLRMRAENNSTGNDSVHVQFSDALNANRAAYARIGTTSSAEFVLQDGSTGTYPHGWGWTDNGWGSLGQNISFASTGTHTVRIQQREDGAIIDQIVISADEYLKTAPGSRTNDTTILSK
jgi:PKD repeat protein